MYAPWAAENLRLTLDAYKKRQMRVVYMELGAKCTMCSCLYCDSPESSTFIGDELSVDATLHIIDQVCRKGLQWLFVCGLGEPSEDPRLLPILRHLKIRKVKLSMFTNGLGFSPHDLDALIKSDIHLLLKLDTFDGDLFDRILGRPGVSDAVYSFLTEIQNRGFPKTTSQGETNLAFSIVPTALNVDSIPDVIRYCKTHSIYPAIGEMEPLGNAALNHDILGLAKDRLHALHADVSEILGYSYRRPLCPGILVDFRIDNLGRCLVDRETGLACGWFLEERHDPIVLGNLIEDNIEIIQDRAYKYRCCRVQDTLELLKRRKPVIASGGGSRPAEWYRLYEQLMTEVKGNFHLRT